MTMDLSILPIEAVMAAWEQRAHQDLVRSVYEMSNYGRIAMQPALDRAVAAKLHSSMVASGISDIVDRSGDSLCRLQVSFAMFMTVREMQAMEAALAAIPSASTLRELRLGRISRTSDLLTAIQHLTKLEILYISALPFNDVEKIDLASLPSVSLRRLKIDQCCFLPYSLRALPSQLTSLRMRCFRKDGIWPTDPIPLDLIGHLTELRELQLRPMPDASYTQFHKLEKLTIRWASSPASEGRFPASLLHLCLWDVGDWDDIGHIPNTIESLTLVEDSNSRSTEDMERMASNIEQKIRGQCRHLPAKVSIVLNYIDALQRLPTVVRKIQ
jgi:hypothetical protein